MRNLRICIRTHSTDTLSIVKLCLGRAPFHVSLNVFISISKLGEEVGDVGLLSCLFAFWNRYGDGIIPVDDLLAQSRAFPAHLGFPLKYVATATRNNCESDVWTNDLRHVKIISARLRHKRQTIFRHSNPVAAKIIRSSCRCFRQRTVVTPSTIDISLTHTNQSLLHFIVSQSNSQLLIKSRFNCINYHVARPQARSHLDPTTRLSGMMVIRRFLV
ncbi:hypothetical protein V1505DRAFT_360841 [Lipomyces doorenjongii]